MPTLLSREQIRRVDELAARQYGIAGIVLMENAGRNAAAIIDAVYGPGARSGFDPQEQSAAASEPSVPTGQTERRPPGSDDHEPNSRSNARSDPAAETDRPAAPRAVIFCGTGNNGGDGLVIARHLHNRAWSVRLAILGDPSKMSPDAAANFRTTAAMGLETFVMADQADRVAACDSIRDDEVMVDALLGTGVRGTVREDAFGVIDGINRAARRAVVAVDVPSGLDCDTGEPCGIAVRADLTITFAANKVGFSTPAAAQWVGRIEVADIGAPKELIAEVARAGAST